MATRFADLESWLARLDEEVNVCRESGAVVDRALRRAMTTNGGIRRVIYASSAGALDPPRVEWLQR